MTQQYLFGTPAPTTTTVQSTSGKLLRDRGIKKVGARNPEFLETLRTKAREIAAQNGFVTSDDMREYADSIGLSPTHPACWGAVFRNGEWDCVGWQDSRIASNHARPIRCWKPKETPS